MDLLISLATKVDRLDPAISAVLAHFRDERVPVELSAAIVAAAAILLIAVIACGATAVARIGRLRSVVRACGTGATFAANFARLDRRLSASLVGDSWSEFRKCLRQTDAGVLFLRRPDEFLGLHAIDNKAYPARFFAAAHGYFIGVGLVLTFLGLVAALKFAAVGVASPDIAVAKDALDALLAAAAFKFMTSIAGLGSSLTLSIVARSMTYAVESAALGLARDLERGMEPVFSECLAYDQLAATQAQSGQLERIDAGLRASLARQAATPLPAAPTAASGESQSIEALQRTLATFLTEMRGAAGSEMKQIATKLSDVGDAVGSMQNHISRSGQNFAAQIDLAAQRLLAAATKMQESVDVRADQAGARLEARIDDLAGVLSKGEAVVANAADKAARSLSGSVGEFDTSLRAQVGSMREIVGALDRTRAMLNESAVIWTQAAEPVIASVEASRQISSELNQVAGRVGAAQRDMTEMAQAVAQLSEKIGAVWDNYRSRFEKVDGELQAVFERLQGGTRAFGEEVMDFVGKLDASLAKGMQAFSLGTEELREIAQMFVINGDAKAA